MVANQAEKKLKILWRSQQAMLIKELCNKENLNTRFQRTLVPPPLNFIYYVLRTLYISGKNIYRGDPFW